MNTPEMIIAILRFTESKKDGGKSFVKEYEVPADMPKPDQVEWAENLWQQEFGQSDLCLLSIAV